MIKIVSAAYHMNIGDSRSSQLLKGYIDTISYFGSQLVGYEGTDFTSRDQVEKYCIETNAIIIGTGGCFHSADTGKVFTASNPELYKYITCPLIIMATGFNRDYERFAWSNGWSEMIHALLSRADIIGMRTIDDKELAISLGADRSKTFCCPDPLLFIGSDQKIFDINKACVSLYTDKWENIISQVINDNDFYIQKSEHDNTSFRFYDYADSDFVVTKRFHGQMIAFAFGKPCFSIESNIKHRFARQMLYQPDLYHYIDNHLIDLEFRNKFQDFLANKERMRYYIKPRLTELKQVFTDFLLKVERCIN